MLKRDRNKLWLKIVCFSVKTRLQPTLLELVHIEELTMRVFLAALTKTKSIDRSVRRAAQTRVSLKDQNNPRQVPFWPMFSERPLVYSMLHE